MYQKKFMQEAISLAKNSEDPNTKVGCYLINRKGRHVGMGYNRMPIDSKSNFPWSKTGKLYETKYPYVIHAEMAAMIEGLKENRNFLSHELEVYVTLFPCSNCAKMLVEFGAKTIYYLDDKYAATEDVIASKALLRGCGVEYKQVEDPNGN